MASAALAPWTPGGSDPFDRRKAAHLLRRAGFGAAPGDVDKAVEQGLEAAVEGLFDEAGDEEEAFQTTFRAIEGTLTNFAEVEGVQAWWVYRMLRTRVPLREKLTLFWHGHFATNHEKVEDLALAYHQIETLRRLAWGNLRELTLAMARDPAMLVWLDGQSSTKEHPNENFARELLELFTCGIGHYTEHDVREAARAFTGWHRDKETFVFHAESHDFGRKTFLGKSGKLDGGDIVDILMQEPSTARFLAAKLLRFFAAPEPAPAVIDEAAALLSHTHLDVKWFLRELFQSRYFYSPACLRTRVASPAEYVVGTLRALAVRMPAPAAVEAMNGMGQELLSPPNVKGWDGERKWINSSTWAARTGFARTVAELAGEGSFASRLDLDQLLPDAPKDPARAVDALAEALLQGDLPASARQSLAEALVQTDDGPNPETFRDDDDFRDGKIREALGVILGLPEYHAY